MGIVETHVGARTRQEWARKTRGLNLKYVGNCARHRGSCSGDSSRDARANEGGELVLAHGHRHFHRFVAKGKELPRLCADGTEELDGFMPVAVHQRGFTFIAVMFYGHAWLGFHGGSIQTYARLGSFLRSLQLPWLVAGDFNIGVDGVQRSLFLKKIQGRVIRAPAEFTNVGGNGDSHIDFVVASTTCLPSIRDVAAVQDVPRAPHCGLVITIKSTGEQLIARTMPSAPRLPQLARPSQPAASV
eukprot:8107918-Pyramimonas_sp.AAC.1